MLVSSLKRALVAETSTSETELNQVGQQERKNSAPFGADFGYSENETVIYSSRPGLRLWLSDCQGAVQQTLIFKDSLSKPRSKLILLSIHEEYSNGEAQFGPVFCLSNGLVLTYSPSSLFILDTGQMGEESGQVSVFCSSRFNPKTLRHATVFHNEIFLLLENRTLIRISDRPDQSCTVPSSSASIDRPLLSGWRDKLPVKPTFQSTITKLANKISENLDVEIKPLSAPVTNTGPYIIESLSNALAPLFDMKTLPINRCAPPKPIQPHFLSRTRTPSPTALGERCSPTFQQTTTGNHHLESNQRESPLSNCSSGQASPMDGSVFTGDEELVYGSYIGRKRKLKLNRKLSAHEEPVLLSESFCQTTENGAEPWLLGNNTDPVTKDDFLEELKRKDQLLAELLQLDQVTVTSNEEIPSEEQVQESAVTQPYPESKSPSPVSEDMNSVDDEIQDQPKENIYSIYASEEDALDKSTPFTRPTPTTEESTPNETALSSGDYETISPVIVTVHSVAYFVLN